MYGNVSGVFTGHQAIHGGRDAGQRCGKLEENVVGGAGRCGGAQALILQGQLPIVGVSAAHETNGEGVPGGWKQGRGGGGGHLRQECKLNTFSTLELIIRDVPIPLFHF